MAAKSAIVLVLSWSAIASAQDARQDAAPDAAALNNQALALSEKGLFKDAENLYQSALAFEPSDQLVRAKVASNLASLYRRQDRYRDAEQALRRALEWHQKSLPPASVEIAYSFNNLADVYLIEGRDWEARNLLETAIRNLREFHPDATGFPVIASNLAMVLCKFSEFDQAEVLLRAALSESERIDGAGSREVGIAMNNLGQVLRAKKDFAGAAVLYTRAMDIFEELGRKAIPDLSTVLANTGQLLACQHQESQARQFEERAFNLLSADGNGPLRSAIMQNLGNILANSGRAADSLPYFEKALNIQEATLGVEHPATVNILRDYAVATSRAGLKSLSHKLRKRADELVARLHGQAPQRFTVSVRSLTRAAG